MRILAVGGGSGGHVTPVVAVLKQLKKDHPRAELRFWVDTAFAPQARAILASFDAHMPVQTIAAGKLRRYHHLTPLQHLLWPSLVWRNGIDSFKVVAGFIQSLGKLILWRPDVVFAKGGYVCLPVGMAARVLRIPLVIHDSDAHPGLTNRILSRWATKIATGAPLEYYSYPAAKARYVGIPINEAFQPATTRRQAQLKTEWQVASDRPLVVVTGGGLGARRLNRVVFDVLPKLQQIASVIVVSGEAHFSSLRQEVPHDSSSFRLYPFVKEMASLLSAADVVVTRAGATTMLELAALAKPTIIVPNAALTGGHQLKNAAVYGEAQAAIVIDEDEMVETPTMLYDAVKAYLDDPKTMAAMAKRLHGFAKPNAAKEMAALVVSATRR